MRNHEISVIFNVRRADNDLNDLNNGALGNYCTFRNNAHLSTLQSEMFARVSGEGYVFPGILRLFENRQSFSPALFPRLTADPRENAESHR